MMPEEFLAKLAQIRIDYRATMIQADKDIATFDAIQKRYGATTGPTPAGMRAYVVEGAMTKIAALAAVFLRDPEEPIAELANEVHDSSLAPAPTSPLWISR